MKWFLNRQETGAIGWLAVGSVLDFRLPKEPVLSYPIKVWLTNSLSWGE